MRYNHFYSVLPERAFKPRSGKRIGFASGGMTLEGGESFTPQEWSQDVIDAVMGNQGGQDISAQQIVATPQELPVTPPSDARPSSQGTNAPSGGGADLNALYQQLLGRGVDPSGAATFANMSQQDVINSILSSPEYAGRSAAGLGTLSPDALATLQAANIGFITAPVGMDPKDYAANGFDATGKKKQSLFGGNNSTQAFNFTNPADFQTKDYQSVSKGNPFVQDINNVYMSLLGRPATPTEILNDSKMLYANPDDYNKLIGRVLDSPEFSTASKSGKQNLLGGVAARTTIGDEQGARDAIDPLTNTTNWLGMSYNKYKPTEESGFSKITNDIGGMIPYAALAAMTGGLGAEAGLGAIASGALGGATAGTARGAIEGGNILRSALTGAVIGGVTGGVFDAFGNPVDIGNTTLGDAELGNAIRNMQAANTPNPYNNFNFGSFTSPTFDLNPAILNSGFTPQEIEAIRLGQQDANAAINTGTQSAGNPSYLENTPIEPTYSRNFVDQAPFEANFPTQPTLQSDIVPRPTPDTIDPLVTETNAQLAKNFAARYPNFDPTDTELLNQIAQGQGVFPEGSIALPTSIAPETTLLQDIQNGSKDALEWVKENPYSAAGILGATALGALGIMGKGPLAFLGGILGTAKKKDDTPTTPAPSGPSKPGTPGTPGKLPINPKTGKPYGAGELDPNYLLRNRINASNVYSGATGYAKPFAQGGEVKHFGLGGLSDSLTKVFQPIEKSVVQPIGRAIPILKDALPYAGMIAAPFIASPMAAAGVGALASGIGQGGFNFKRALMGGISAYGLSNLGAGVEAAGSLTPAAETAGVSVPTEANNFFRSPETMSQGLQNLAAGGNSYKLAAANFATKAGMPSAAMSIMGAAGVNAVNEGITQQNQANEAQAQADSTGAARQAKIDRQKKYAIDTMNKYPYQYAMGGQVDSVDDQTGISSQSPIQGMEHGGYLGYAAGGYAMGGRFLSGGGDGMSDSIHASIEGNQEARLADGEFVIPADVVSHIGNGSSKAGAKQLYNMMDRIRQARTGNKKQGREIKPTKFMPA